ncbi:hypothetical protein ST37_06800 [Vibrio sp. qd031]|uniref:hypothetical protein n=1 Tax=Vibrio sp. qd031 TaxID=1603038 RepID=UPI000A110E70|nr:hypothetical protein [Vibrio sp. qd031]ORT51074.1 hypothetical protein ST37_06800 [Vibrio sp. qd031]
MTNPDSVILYYQKDGVLLKKDFSKYGLSNATRVAHTIPSSQPWLIALGNGGIASQSKDSHELEHIIFDNETSDQRD